MDLLIDAGNSRIKLGWHDRSGWRLKRTLALDELADFDWSQMPCPQRIFAANVAGRQVTDALQAALAFFNVPIEWAGVEAYGNGVQNGYREPGQLGIDRWLAAIAAWRTVGNACLIVGAGTATTIDVLDAQGIFQGGCIVAGVDLMLRSLASGTAQLPLVDAALVQLCAETMKAPPRSTAEAIVAGCVHAQLGAIERMRAFLPSSAPVLLTGGARRWLLPHLEMRVIEMEDLVLEGLRYLASDH